MNRPYPLPILGAAAMAYSDFSLSQLKKQFGLQIDEQISLFAAVEPVPCSELLSQTLEENVPLAIAINTEKARSEMIITSKMCNRFWASLCT